MKQTESPYLISGTPIPSISRFGPRSPFSCSVDIKKFKCTENKKEHTHSHTNHGLLKSGIKEYYEWMGFRRTLDKNVFIGLPGGNRQPHYRHTIVAKETKSRFWQDRRVYNWVPVFKMVKHCIAFCGLLAVDLHENGLNCDLEAAIQSKYGCPVWIVITEDTYTPLSMTSKPGRLLQYLLLLTTMYLRVCNTSIRYCYRLQGWVFVLYVPKKQNKKKTNIDSSIKNNVVTFCVCIPVTATHVL